MSSDPTVRADGTSVPLRRDAHQIVSHLDLIAQAALQATRSGDDALRTRGSLARATAIRVATSLGAHRKLAIADWLGMRYERIRDLLGTAATAEERQAVAAALYLLSDFQRFTRNSENR